ncbi:MAG: right-handed parallel beta-helix repeat-containing protein [Anaerolineae bacterium]
MATNTKRGWTTGDTVAAADANRWENRARSHTYIYAPYNADQRVKDGADEVGVSDLAFNRLGLQLAIEAADDVHGAPLKLVAGTVNIDREITIVAANGGGMEGENGRTTIAANAAWQSQATRMLENPGTSAARRSYARVKDVYFDGNKGSVSYTTNGIVFDYNDYVLIEGCTFNNNRGYGINLNNCSRVIIRNCTFLNSADYAIRLTSCSNVFVENCYFYVCYGGVWIDNSTDVSVVNCKIQQPTYHGVYVNGTGCFRPVILGNTITNSASGHGIDFYCGGARTRLNSVISSNVLQQNNLRGIYLDGYDKNLVVGNSSVGNYQHGINMLNSDEDTITGNYTELNSLRGIHIESSSRRCAIVGNKSVNDGNIGISIWSSSHDALVEGNEVYYNGQQGIAVDTCDRANVTGNTVHSSNYEGISVYNCDSPSVRGNYLFSNSRSSNLGYAHIKLSGTSKNGVVAHNTCRWDSSAGWKTNYGVYINGTGATGNYVCENDLRYGYGTAALQQDTAATTLLATNSNWS